MYSSLSRVEKPALFPSPVVIAVLAGAGVTLHLGWAEEELYVETRPEFIPSALHSALRMVASLGLEMIDEDEELPTVWPDGRVRFYLANSSN